ncbi:MAG: hypothetical protein M3128_06780 [Verrucomicrobiota bacterium]|nr:hypothetical protein [Verrucomicrobiota bacterium]
MKSYKRLLIALILVVSALLPVANSYAGIFIELGDRGYYTRGNYYVEHGHRWCWVPGHWGRHHHWIHGHYRHCY